MFLNPDGTAEAVPPRIVGRPFTGRQQIPLTVSCDHTPVTLTPLPLMAHIDDVRAALARHRAAVLTAAPGAGKTTRVPPALIDRGRVLLLQPRRVAARAMARRIADERGWTLGREVGWHIRFERRFTRDTRLLVVTEGILTAYLQRDPLLSDVATLILDEFHERSVHADLGLALAKQAWARARRSSDRGDVGDARHRAGVRHSSTWLPGHRGAGHAASVDARLCARDSRGAARSTRSCRDRAATCCASFRARRDIEAAMRGRGGGSAGAQDAELIPLHGSLDSRDQDAALQPGDRRRIVVATNVAETSLTVPGVSLVIDSGLHKVARYDTDRAIDSLVDRTRHARQRRSARRSRRAARSRPRAAALGRTRSPSAASRSRHSPDRSRRPGACDPEPGCGSVQLRMVRCTLARSDRCGNGTPRAAWRRAGRSRARSRARDCSALPLSPRLARVLLEANGVV